MLENKIMLIMKISTGIENTHQNYNTFMYIRIKQIIKDKWSTRVYIRVMNKYTKQMYSGAGTANPSGAPEFAFGFSWGSCCSIFSFLCSVL